MKERVAKTPDEACSLSWWDKHARTGGIAMSEHVRPKAKPRMESTPEPLLACTCVTLALREREQIAAPKSRIRILLVDY